MKEFTNYLFILLFIFTLSSCKINVGDGDKDPEDPNGNNDDFIVLDQPSDFATNVSLTPMLSWHYNSGSQGLTFNVYLDTFSQPNTQVASNVPPNNYQVITALAGNKTYYWFIETFYENKSYRSAVRRFTTLNNPIPTNGLIAYYPFNGNTNDESGKGNNGVNNGASSTADRFNVYSKAFSFNSSNSYISVPHNSILQPTTGLTVSSWFQIFNSYDGGIILGKGTENMSGWYGLKYDSSSQTIDFEINFSDNTLSKVSVFVSNGGWINVIGTFDGSNMRIYYNGIQANLISVSNNLGANLEDLRIGNNIDGNQFYGNIDDIRIYDRALNSNEIQQLYHEGGWNK